MAASPPVRAFAGSSSENYLLRALPSAELRKLRAELEPVDLPIHHEIYASETEIRQVVFPRTMMVSLVTSMEDGTTVEMGIVGRHGMVGLPIFLGAKTAPSEAFVQVAGVGWKLDASAFRRLATPGTQLHARLLRYTQAFLVQSGQAAACNALHSLAQRCARWLLMTSDEIGEVSEYPLTQDFLAQMLGVRRAGVSGAETALQKKKLILSRRGRITILDREGLESAACECYGIIRRETERLAG